ncbi:hypothetical protein ASF17_12215 [Frigoribacterium sp. Leaf263]|uniref:hypothetical protein n=1 Tax=Frigoribacterium sp. Leaf263 TaxID=1736313 RepID=UPI0006F3FB37|nr:hypothetical protein [Frigoribacterium sp. Leaf263]KQO81862.1 hypothetical protein ASF17_12215 [Frigoribacterium sp. Leaf263]
MDDDCARDDGAAFEATKPLGGRTAVVLRRLLAAGVLVDLVVAGFVLSQVPLDTTISYTRVSNEWQIPIFALFAAPALLLTLWWQTRKAEDQPLPPKERVFLIAIFVPFLAFFVGAQFFMARDYLISGGALVS